MTWNYSYTPYFLPSFTTILLLLVIFIYSWRRRSMPGGFADFHWRFVNGVIGIGDRSAIFSGR